MVKTKKQKVRFHKGDKRPGPGVNKKLSYKVEPVTKGTRYSYISWIW